MFKVGMRVWDFKYGRGTVVEIRTSDKAFPVCVNFDNNEDWSESYTVDGRTNEQWNRTLFFREFDIPKEALNPPRKPAGEMLDECEEVKYDYKKGNYRLTFIMNGNVSWAADIAHRAIGAKYISFEDAVRIVEECKENHKEA